MQCIFEIIARKAVLCHFKPENIMITPSSSNQVVFIDFGHASLNAPEEFLWSIQLYDSPNVQEEADTKESGCNLMWWWQYASYRCFDMGDPIEQTWPLINATGVRNIVVCIALVYSLSGITLAWTHEFTGSDSEMFIDLPRYFVTFPSGSAPVFVGNNRDVGRARAKLDMSGIEKQTSEHKESKE
ncbi:hypothetical protein EV421DRAFT_1737521 [Armillaria borealis]|uniref:Protein kinase domain-containing protein n=1 Tax=Armillaria borealis TaxID=47425 RepID=A0AA39JDQ0_9AGAR|nr:hypothetical protein EV421DRAFT_1737521 [Armillaria borealis]